MAMKTAHKLKKRIERQKKLQNDAVATNPCINKQDRLVSIPKDQWPYSPDKTRTEVWLSRDFLAQVFLEDEGVVRVSCNRVRRKNGKWADNITWDELMEVKRQIGRSQEYAVEVLPADYDIVNVAPMRHFWILPDAIVGWKAPRQ